MMGSTLISLRRTDESLMSRAHTSLRNIPLKLRKIRLLNNRD
jgi:hypothetical protein